MIMERWRLLVLIFSTLFLHYFLPTAVAQCSKAFTFQGIQKSYAVCLSLPYHNASLSWNYYADKFIFDYAFRSTLTQPGGWVGWGFNPTGTGMIGSSSLMAFQSNQNGSNVLPYKLIGSSTPPSAIDIAWVNPNSSSVVIEDLEVTIFARFQLQVGQTKLNQLWNRGDSVSGFQPLSHSLDGDSMLSFGELDVETGSITRAKAPHIGLKNKHGFINAVAWGIVFPLGIVAARYMRPFAVFNPWWFYVHVTCQTLGYILGCVGFGTGLALQRVSGNIKTKHRDIGIAMFVFATLQILALVLRPKPDHKLRQYWNLYHHTIGYTLLICSIINVYEGFLILNPTKGWKIAYSAVLISIAVVVLTFEIGTWIAWLLQRRRSQGDDKNKKLQIQNEDRNEGQLSPEAQL